MALLKSTFPRLWALTHRRRLERDMDEEIRFHLEMEIAENLRRGLSPAEARRVALRDFGGVEKTKEECRESRGWRWLDVLAQDLRFGLRMLRKSPGFSLAVVVTLALGIGANTAVFSVIHGVLLAPLPFAHDGRLMVLHQEAPLAGYADVNFSVPEIEDFRQRNHTFDALAEYHSMWFNLLDRGEPARVQTGVVSAGFFDLLGVKPLVGRTFLPADDQAGAEPVLVVSYGFWQRHLGADPAIVGRTFELNDRVHTVIGVLPPVPQYPDENDVYMPTSACPFRSNPETVKNRSGHGYTLFGLRSAGVDLAAARADLAAIAADLAREHPDAYPPGSGYTATAVPLALELTRAARPILLVLQATVLCVLLLVCANVANLSLSRLLRRERELTVRAALGAGRGRLLRQLLTESLLLALAGGGLGLLLASPTVDLLAAYAARFTPRAAEVRIDGAVLLFTLAVSLAAGLASGVLPALPRRRGLAGALRQSADHAPASPARSRLRDLLVVVQVAASCLLLTGAALMLRTLVNLQRVDPGFRTAGVETLQIDLDWTRYREVPRRREFSRRLLDRAAAAPGVLSAAVATSFPLNDLTPGNAQLMAEEHPLAPGELAPPVDFYAVSPAYFDTLGIPVLSGRRFSVADGAEGGPLVAVVDATLARRLWGDRDPIGHRIKIGRGDGWRTVVGVAGDTRQYALDQAPKEVVYVPLAEGGWLSTTLLVRAAEPPAAAAASLRAALRAVDPLQPAGRIRTLEQVRSDSLAPRRLTTALLGLFALLALLITATGLGGVLAFSVSQRTPEIGVRMALGAAPRSILGMVLGKGLGLVAAGLALGTAGGLALSRLMSGLLYGVAPGDPVTSLAAATALFAVGAAACLVPARRATAIDPMVALRTA